MIRHTGTAEHADHDLQPRDRGLCMRTKAETRRGDATRDVDVALAARRFDVIYASNMFGLCFGEGSRILEANDAFLHDIGATREHVDAGISLESIFLDTEAARSPAKVAGEYEVRRIDGSHAHLLATGTRLSEAEWVLLAVDLTQRKATERAIAHLALHDPVTGLANRRLLFDRVQHALSRANRHAGRVAVLYCDIDHFKQINDTFGHRAGDLVLQDVARRLQSVMREDDTIARVGGDEFVVVFEELSDATEATRIAERARVAMSLPVEVDGQELQVTASIGLSLSGRPGEDVDSLLRRADDAMYVAKGNGRNQVAFARDELTTGGEES
jgi:diguanylate cyclase (GGDEF)-like protein